MAEVDPAVAAAAAANNGEAELAAATAAVLPFSEDLFKLVNEFLSVIGTERSLCRLNRAGRDGVASASQTRAQAARNVLLDQARARAAVARPSRGPYDRARARACPPLARSSVSTTRAWGVRRAICRPPRARRWRATAVSASRTLCSRCWSEWCRGASRRRSTSGTRARALESRVSRRRSDARASPPLPLAQEQRDRRRGRAGAGARAPSHRDHDPRPPVRARARSREPGLAPAL